MPAGSGSGTLGHMTTARNRPEPTLLVDMATLRYRWGPDRRSCALLLSTGELVVVVDVDDPSEDVRVVAYRALDAALDRGRVQRLRADGRTVTVPVAVYNPFSAEVSVGPVPHTVTFTDEDPLPVPAEGCMVNVHGGRGRRVEVAGRTLLPRELTLTEMTRTQMSHQAA